MKYVVWEMQWSLKYKIWTMKYVVWEINEVWNIKYEPWNMMRNVMKFEL